MRFVVKSDADKTAKLSSVSTTAALLDIATNMAKDKISDSIYRESYEHPDEKKSKVEDQLALSYFNKCAYCERLQKADIEHYRPKKAVVEDPSHNGYYWLCYEWTNSIPSCVKCNREGAKHSQFPILGKRVKNPSFLKGNLNPNHQKAKNSPLVDEKPLLLHPEVDKPDLFFDFIIDAEGEGIRIRGIDAEGRGEGTISICLLNRLEIKLERVAFVIDPFKHAVESAFVKLSRGEYNDDQFVNQIIFQLNQLKSNSLKVESTHTLLRKFIVASEDNFQNIVLPYLNSKIRKVVFEAFRSL